MITIIVNCKLCGDTDRYFSKNKIDTSLKLFIKKKIKSIIKYTQILQKKGQFKSEI